MKNIRLVRDYIQKNNLLKEYFKNQVPTINKIDDGNLNNIYLLSIFNNECNPLIIKHYPNHIIENKEKINMPRNRAYNEYNGLNIFKKNSFKYVPELFFYDEKNSLIITKYIQNSNNLKEILFNNRNFNQYIPSLSDFIVTNEIKNSLVFNKDNEYLLQLINNIDYKDYIYNILFTLDKNILKENRKIKESVDYLKTLFKKEEVLNHGNFKKDSILIKNNSIFVLDYETIFIGSHGFDLSRILSDFFLDYIFYSKINNSYALHILINISQLIDKYLKEISNELKEINIKELQRNLFGFLALNIIYNTKLLIANKTASKEFINTLLTFGFNILYKFEKIQNTEDIVNLIPKINL